MLDHAGQWVQEIVAMKSIWRVLWLSLVLSIAFVIFESKTHYFETTSISRRVDVLDKVSKPPLSPEQTARIEKLKNQALAELEHLDTKDGPINQAGGILVQFLKGAWVTLPLFAAVVWLFWLVIKQKLEGENKLVALQARGFLLLLAWRAFSIVTWLMTVLGMASALWNTSQNFFTGWILFPVCSATGLGIALFLLTALRSLVPKETQIAPATQGH